MERYHCCVCDKVLKKDEYEYQIGGRRYCHEHYEQAQMALTSHWSTSGIIEVVCSLAFIAILAGMGPEFSSTLAVLSVLVPSAIWLGYVYRQDRLEPEPLSMVLGVTGLGALLTWTLIPSVTEGVYQLSLWQNQSMMSANIASIAVVATLVQLCVFVSVRYSIYLTEEFDELTDGVVYATAAAIGSATALNGRLLLDNEGLSLAGATLMMGTVLIHVASAYPLGVYLSKLRFGQTSSLMVGIAFLFSVVMNGFCRELMVSISSQGVTFQPWIALAICTGMLLVVLLIGSKVIERLQQQTIGSTEEISVTERNPGQDIWVWGIGLLFLLGANGYAGSQIQGDITVQVLEEKVSLHLPLGWTGRDTENGYVAKPIGFERARPQIQIAKVRLAQESNKQDKRVANVGDLQLSQRHQFKSHQIKEEVSLLELSDIELLKLEEKHRQDGTGFRVLNTEEKKAFGGHHSIWSWFALVQEASLKQGIPSVLYGVDVVTIVEGTNEVYTISAWGPTTEWDHSNIEQLINGVTIK